MPVAETRLASISGSRWLLSTLSPAEHVRFDCASTKHPAWADMPMNCDVTVGPKPSGWFGGGSGLSGDVMVAGSRSGSQWRQLPLGGRVGLWGDRLVRG